VLVAICHCQKENAQAKQLASWMAELGPYPNHRLLVGRDERAEPNLFANSGFSSVEEITIIGDAWNHWPESCNNAFRQIAKYIEYGSKEPWLWLEADAVPLKKGWLDQIEAEYKTALDNGKVFLGDFVHINEPGFVDHCSGIAVYPGVMSDHAGDALLAHDLAWDVTGAGQIIPKMHKSKSILHRWKYPAFENWEQVEKRIFQVKPECVLFHSDKRGSLVPLLRERLAKKADSGFFSETFELSEEAIAHNKKFPLGQFIPHPDCPEIPIAQKRPACDIFIKSYPGDYEWLKYCLRSIDKLATGFRRIVLIVPQVNEAWMCQPGMGNLLSIPLNAPLNVKDVREPENGYLFQQVCKLNADKYTDADFVLFMDSDCVFTRPVTPETFMRNGKPIWLMTPLDKARRDQREAWVPVMTKWMNKVPEYEFMRRHPFMFPHWFFDKIRGFCAQQHNQALDGYIMRQPGRAFSEFNCAGFLAYEHFRDRFSWLNTETDEVPSATILQKWSPGGLTDAIEAELENILSTPIENPNIKQTKEGIWVLVNDSHISRWVEEKGSLQHDYETLPQILAEIQPGDTVIDVGAFIGDTTASFLERVGSEGEVFAYEPNMDAWECLRRNCPKAHCLPYALGVAGPSDAVFLELVPSENAGARHLRKFGFDKEKGDSVQVASLDSDNLKRCDLIKIDVEGMELSVLRGAEQTINRFHPKLVIEINEAALARQGSSAEEISHWLSKHGYKWQPLQSNITASSPQYDIFCTYITKKTESCSTASSSIVDWAKFETDARFTSPPSNDSREAIVRDAVAVLKRLCTAPRYISQVRKELKAQGVIR